MCMGCLLRMRVKNSIPSFNSESTSFLTAVHKSYTQTINFDTTKKPNSNVVCKYCKRPGRSIDRCYKLYGYPPGFGNKFKRVAIYAQVSDTQMVGQTEDSGTNNSKVIPTDIGTHVLTKEQYDHLISLLQQSKVSSSPQDLASDSTNFAGLVNSIDFNSGGILGCNVSRIESSVWIIDSGANNYMTPHRYLLKDIKPLLFPYLVSLPNGYKVKVTCTGALSISSDISLPNMLFVPSFHYNLLSLS